jgi:hypothetical protein
LFDDSAASQATREESKGLEHSKLADSELRSTGADGEEISKPDNVGEVQQTVNHNVTQVPNVLFYYISPLMEKYILFLLPFLDLNWE